MSGCGARTAAGSLEAVFESSDVERFVGRAAARRTGGGLLQLPGGTARIIPRIIWGENRAQVRSEPEKTVCGGKPLWDSA
jgi:hypothetical protein